MKLGAWLYRAESRRWLGLAAAVVLLASLLAQLLIPVEAHFALDGGYGFYAAFGLIACAVMVFAARLLGLLVKRPETYYQAKDSGAKPAVLADRASRHADPDDQAAQAGGERIDD